MSKIKRFMDDVYADYEDNVFTIQQLAEKYDVDERFIMNIILLMTEEEGAD